MLSSMNVGNEFVGAILPSRHYKYLPGTLLLAFKHISPNKTLLSSYRNPHTTSMKSKILIVVLMFLILVALVTNIMALHRSAKLHSPSRGAALLPFPFRLSLNDVNKFNKAATAFYKRMDSSTGT